MFRYFTKLSHPWTLKVNIATRYIFVQFACYSLNITTNKSSKIFRKPLTI